MSRAFNEQTTRSGNELSCAAKPRGNSVEFYCSENIDLELETITITRNSQPQPKPSSEPFSNSGHAVSGTLNVRKTP